MQTLIYRHALATVSRFLEATFFPKMSSSEPVAEFPLHSFIRFPLIEGLLNQLGMDSAQEGGSPHDVPEAGRDLEAAHAGSLGIDGAGWCRRLTGPTRTQTVSVFPLYCP